MITSLLCQHKKKENVMCDIKIALKKEKKKKKKIVSGLHAPQNVSPLDRNGQSLQEVFCRLGLTRLRRDSAPHLLQ